MRSYCKVLNFD